MSTKNALKFLSIATVIFLFINSTFKKDKDPLNKRKYDIILIEVKDGVNNKKGVPDELEFKDGKFFSTYLFDKFEYKWLKYKVTKDSAYIDETETEIDYFEVESTYTDAKDQTFIMTLKKVSELDITSFTKATDALKTVDSALQFISGERAKLGALQSRFETSISSLNISAEIQSAARSRIQDADFAAEPANLSRAQILQQAGTAMVAQANQIPQGVLQLLK